MAQRSKTIGIRLAPELERRLRDEAAKRDLAPTTYATRLLVEALTAAANPTEARFAELREILERLEEELPAKLRAIVTAGMVGDRHESPDVEPAPEGGPATTSGFDAMLKKRRAGRGT